MLAHYFKVVLTPMQRQRVHGALEGDDMAGTMTVNMTPAQMEQLAAEHDDIEDMISALEAKGMPLPPLNPTLSKQATSSTVVTFEN